MTCNLQPLRNFIEKFIGTVYFGNDHFAAITGYGNYVQGNLMICHVYYVEGLGHNLFLVGQLCDGDLDVAFCSNTCYVRKLEGNDLLMGSRDSNIYTIISEMATSSPVCLMSRATSTKSWLWHRRLSHLNFGTINQLTSNDLVDGLPKFKYTKDHLCSACDHSKSKKASLPPKLVPSTESKLELLHMYLCGPPGVVELHNRTLVEAARTMLIFSKAPEFLWFEAIATTCFTQNHSIVHTRHNKTPYELIRGEKPNIQYFHVFGSLCYPTNDRDDLGKMKLKADIEYYETSSQEMSDDSIAITTDNDHTSSSLSIVVDQDDAPQTVSSSDEQVATAPNSLVINEVVDEFVQEDVLDFDRNMFHDAPQTLEFEVAESSSTY
ncbi:integrase, catalytic region, zinc finger, CCHC-type containing protein [Tanacetum coccineum]